VHLYHGTTLANALNIRQNGFDVNRGGNRDAGGAASYESCGSKDAQGMLKFYTSADPAKKYCVYPAMLPERSRPGAIVRYSMSIDEFRSLNFHLEQGGENVAPRDLVGPLSEKDNTEEDVYVHSVLQRDGEFFAKLMELPNPVFALETASQQTATTGSCTITHVFFTCDNFVHITGDNFTDLGIPSNHIDTMLEKLPVAYVNPPPPPRRVP